jgi:pimeloyl-ACP methyl ester carboxylesterase
MAAEDPLAYSHSADDVLGDVGQNDSGRGGAVLAAGIALGSAAALAAMAAAVNWAARRAERENPPIGNFIAVDGIRLHYTDTGEGPPVVLLHCNGSMLQDPSIALADKLADRHRVLAFDRPGFGYSERPREITWTPEAQMELILQALRQLGVERPVLYGHSWGASLVVTFALHAPDAIRGVVAASGYYYPNRRLDAAIAVLNVAPAIGPVVRNTVGPMLGALTGRAAVRALFSPNPVPPTFAEFPASLTLRPWQIRASAEDGTALREWAQRSSPHYRDIRVPIAIIAGDSDKAVDYRGHAIRLRYNIPGSQLRIFPDTGHMVHHVHPDEVVDAIERVFEMADDRSSPWRSGDETRSEWALARETEAARSTGS